MTVLFGLILAMLVACMGAALDVAAWLLARTITMTAIDAAVLGGARALQNSGGDAEAAMAVARRIYSQATQKRSVHVRDAIGFEAADGNTAMISKGSASIATTVLNVIGIKDLALLDATEYARAVLPLGRNARQNIEVALVVDASRAVSDETFDLLKDAAKDFGNSLLWAEQTRYSVRLALVPFASGVRPGDDVWQRIAPDLPSGVIVHLADERRARWFASVCAAERVGNAAMSDAAPNDPREMAVIYAPAPACATTGRVQPLTTDKKELAAALDDTKPGGFGAGHVGVAWGWYVLSPNWAGVWPSPAVPQPYRQEGGEPDDQKGLRKILVLASGTGFDTQYCSNATAVVGVAVPDRASAAPPSAKANCRATNGTSAMQAGQLCTNIKNAGIEIYTIALPSSSASAENLLRGCASATANFSAVSDPTILQQVFRTIAANITPIYLAN